MINNLMVYEKMQKVLCNLRGFSLKDENPYQKRIENLDFSAYTSLGLVRGTVDGQIERNSNQEDICWFIRFGNLLGDFSGEIACKFIDTKWNNDAELCKSFDEFLAVQQLVFPSFVVKELFGSKQDVCYSSRFYTNKKEELADLKKILLTCTSEEVFQKIQEYMQVAVQNKTKNINSFRQAFQVEDLIEIFSAIDEKKTKTYYLHH